MRARAIVAIHGKNYRLSVARARDQLLDELRLLGATDVLVSSNVTTRSDGLLHSDPRRLDDPGISVWFRYNGKRLVMARDLFISVAGNLRSLGLAIEALRQLERHGGSVMLERCFEGFLAIAPPDWKKPWREVFGIHREGGIRPHPAVAIERDARLAVARLVRELDLDVGPPPSQRYGPPPLLSNRGRRHAG